MIIRTTKSILTLCGSLFLLLGTIACETQEILIPEVEFFIAKEWKLDKLMGNGIEQTNDMIQEDNPTWNIENYRLNLNKDFSFSQRRITGAALTGTWMLTSGLSQLVLSFEDSLAFKQEHYLLLDLDVRRLEMRVLADPGKLGELDIRYILKPVKGQ